MKRRATSGWDFDAKTPASSNRRIPPLEDECLCCGHMHRNKGGSIVRCWAQIERANMKRRPCKCRVYGGLRAGSKKKVIGPFWGVRSGDLPYHHLWHHEQGGYTAWTLCGKEQVREKLHAGDFRWKKCPTCERSPLAAKAAKRIPRSEPCQGPSVRDIEGLLALYNRCKKSAQTLQRQLARRSLGDEEREVLISEHLELLRLVPPALERMSYRAQQDYLLWLNRVRRKGLSGA